MKFYSVLILVLWSGVVHAFCQDPQFTDSDQISLDNDSVLIVTHASATYDPRYASKRGIDEATGYAKNKGFPIVYLQDSTPGQNYFTDDCNPQYRVYSENGEIDFEVKPSHVYVVGGHLEQCLYNTVQNVLDSWAKQPARNLTLTFLMDGIYSNGDLIRETDSYAKDFDLFMRTQTYRRSDDDPWPKVTLLESLGVINQEQGEVEYLRRALPYIGNDLLPGYRVELQLEDSPTQVLQAAPDLGAPTLRLRFIDSALKLEPI